MLCNFMHILGFFLFAVKFIWTLLLNFMFKWGVKVKTKVKLTPVSLCLCRYSSHPLHPSFLLFLFLLDPPRPALVKPLLTVRIPPLFIALAFLRPIKTEFWRFWSFFVRFSLLHSSFREMEGQLATAWMDVWDDQ